MTEILSPEQLLKRSEDSLAWQYLDKQMTYQDLLSLVEMYRAACPFTEASHWAVRGFTPLETFALLLAGISQGAVMYPLPERMPLAIQERMLQQIPNIAVLQPENLNLCPKLYGKATTATPWNGERPALGIFTSGSTGVPKAILHSWQSLLASAKATAEFYKMQKGDRCLLSLDLAHIGGLQIALRCLLVTGVCVYRAEPNQLSKALSLGPVDFVSMVPTQLYRLLPDRSLWPLLKQCRAIILGGAAASQQLLAQALGLALPVSVSYGMTETAAQCAGFPPGTFPEQEGIVGEIFPGWELRCDQDQVWLKGAATALGFYQAQILTPLVDKDGWLRLPDRAHCRDRTLHILGRNDEIFQVSGENIAPKAILNPLEVLRSEADFLLLPLADEEYGALSILIIRAPQRPDVDPIFELWQDKIASIQRPKRIYWHESQEVTKMSRSFYESLLARQELVLLWSDPFGKV